MAGNINVSRTHGEHSVSRTVRVQGHLDDGNLPAFLESCLLLLSGFRLKVLHYVLIVKHTHREHNYGLSQQQTFSTDSNINSVSIIKTVMCQHFKGIADIVSSRHQHFSVFHADGEKTSYILT